MVKIYLIYSKCLFNKCFHIMNQSYQYIEILNSDHIFNMSGLNPRYPSRLSRYTHYIIMKKFYSLK